MYGSTRASGWNSPGLLTRPESADSLPTETVQKTGLCTAPSRQASRQLNQVAVRRCYKGKPEYKLGCQNPKIDSTGEPIVHGSRF
jgi:hypothetical protein